MLRIVRLVLVLSLSTLGAVSLSPPSAVAAKRSCGVYSGAGGPFEVRVIKGTVRCRTAQRITRRYVSSDEPCSGSGCYRTIGGWLCGSANASAFPRLFSCQRDRKRIGAYSTAD